MGAMLDSEEVRETPDHSLLLSHSVPLPHTSDCLVTAEPDMALVSHGFVAQGRGKILYKWKIDFQESMHFFYLTFYYVMEFTFLLSH